MNCYSNEYETFVCHECETPTDKTFHNGKNFIGVCEECHDDRAYFKIVSPVELEMLTIEE